MDDDALLAATRHDPEAFASCSRAARRVTIIWRDAAGRELRRVPFSAG